MRKRNESKSAKKERTGLFGKNKKNRNSYYKTIARTNDLIELEKKLHNSLETMF